MQTPQKVGESHDAVFSESFLISPEIESLSLTLLDFNPNLPPSSTSLSPHIKNETSGHGNEASSQPVPLMPNSLARATPRTGIVAASESQTLMPNSLSKATSIHEISHIPAESSKPCTKERWASIRQPLLMISYAVAGIILALAHHFYYLSLHGKQAGSASRQQWATIFGTTLSFVVIALLRTAIGEAYTQYIWNLVKRRSYTLGCLDKLFALTSNPLGLFSWELLRHAKLGLTLALTVWCIATAGVTPPGTLAVVPGRFSTTTVTPWPSFNWSSTNWFQINSNSPLPASHVLTTAMLAAESMQIVPINPPATNTSFRLQLFGPALQCGPANETQLPVFEYYSSALANGERVMTKSTFETNDSSLKFSGQGALPLMLQFSAFAPMLPIRNSSENEGFPPGIISSTNSNAGGFDQFNDWIADLPEGFNTSFGPYPVQEGVWTSERSITPLQLWIQTANESFVCTLMNASYEVQFDYVAGTQQVFVLDVSYLEPLYVGSHPISLDLDPINYHAYISVFIATTNMLSGNVTTSITRVSESGLTKTSLWDSSSRILLTGLQACEDFTDNFWTSNPISGFSGPNATVYPVFLNESNIAEGDDSPHRLITNYTENIFTEPAWMCRNRSLTRAIEDLSHNITISMLSSADLLSPNTTMVNITYFPTHNMYQYNSNNLILSYSIGILITAIGVCFGLYSFHKNGAFHSTSFSAVIASTRNPDLDIISDSKDKQLLCLKLRFGAVSTGINTGRQCESRTVVGTRQVFALEDLEC